MVALICNVCLQSSGFSGDGRSFAIPVIIVLSAYCPCLAEVYGKDCLLLFLASYLSDWWPRYSLGLRALNRQIFDQSSVKVPWCLRNLTSCDSILSVHYQ